MVVAGKAGIEGVDVLSFAGRQCRRVGTVKLRGACPVARERAPSAVPGMSGKKGSSREGYCGPRSCQMTGLKTETGRPTLRSFITTLPNLLVW
jgi:hypothetical protein